MTFAIVLANADQIILVSDRRLTARGELFDDDFSKIGHVSCIDASFLYCFTGLAQVGATRMTTDWLSHTLMEIGQFHASYRDIDKALVKRATQFFNESPFLRRLSASNRRLTIMFCGYMWDGYIINSLISNFQDFENFIDYPEALDKFTLYPGRSKFPASENPTMIQAIGQFGALTDSDVTELRRMLVDRVPAEAIRQKAIGLVQRIADRPSVQGTVGKRVNTARITWSEPRIPSAGYASDIVENRLPVVDQLVIASGGQTIATTAAQFSVPSSIVVPKVHRNAHCPCRSGKRYRDCHGRSR